MTIDISEKAIKHLKIFLSRILLQPHEIEAYREIVGSLNRATMQKEVTMKIVKDNIPEVKEVAK